MNKSTFKVRIKNHQKYLLSLLCTLINSNCKYILIFNVILNLEANFEGLFGLIVVSAYKYNMTEI